MNIYDLDIDDLIEYFLSIGEKKYRAEQIFRALYKDKIEKIEDITTIKKELAIAIEKKFPSTRIVIEEDQTSSDKTRKFLFKLVDGNLIETVLMKHDYGYSLCISSQVGCNMGCVFCASGLLKKKRDLTISEMVLQILEVEYITNIRVSSVVVMGIGEPFDNYDNLMKFIRIINHPLGLAIGARHITVSTCGLINRIKDFSNEGLQTNLAISLHAANDCLRDKLVPINKKYPLDELMKAIKDYINKTNRRVTIEYVLLKDVNDSLKNAEELYKLVRGFNIYINLIPYNSVEENEFKRSEKTDLFFDYLKKKDLNVTKRREQGLDIDAACGQLRIKRS